MELNNVPAARPRNMVPPSAQAEKRKSSFERYSMVLPPLQEEATPDPTPVSTLTRAVGNAFVRPDFDLVGLKLMDRGEDVAEGTENMIDEAKQEDEMLHFSEHWAVRPRLIAFNLCFLLAHVDEPLPRVDVSPLIKYRPPNPNTDSQTIQVDVMSIAGSTALPLGLTHIFHDTEILAIIYRSKSNSSGLMSSTVWSWQGKSSSMESSEERKLAELAKRYGTSIVRIRSCSRMTSLR
jgi:hypothetical protein